MEERKEEKEQDKNESVDRDSLVLRTIQEVVAGRGQYRNLQKEDRERLVGALLRS